MSVINIPLICYVLKASIRDKLILSLIVLFLAASSLSFFIGGSATAEPDAAVLTFIANSARFIGVLSLILFTVFYVRRAYETHDIEYLLSRPVTRIHFIIAHLLALSLLSLLFTIVISAGLTLFASHILNIDGFILWSVSLGLEFMIIAYAAFFFSMTLSSAVSGTMATLAAYVLARMSGQVLAIIDSGSQGGSYILSKIMEAASVIVPRFDLFSQSSWLIYGPDASIGLLFFVIHGGLFLFLIACASIFDLQLKEF